MSEYVCPVIVRNIRASVEHTHNGKCSLILEELDSYRRLDIHQLPADLSPFLLRLVIVTIESDAFIFDELATYIEGAVEMLILVSEVLQDDFAYAPTVMDMFFTLLEGRMIKDHVAFVQSEWRDGNSASPFQEG